VKNDWLSGESMRIELIFDKSRNFFWCGSVEMSSEVNKMVPDIQEECKATPKPEEEVKLEEEEEEIAKSRLEELKSRLGLRGDSIFAILLHGIMRTVLEESKVRLAEEMVSFRKSIAEQMLNCSELKMNEEVNLLKLDGSFRAAWNKWLETPHEQRAEEAYNVFESCLFEPETADEQAEAERQRDISDIT